VVAPLPASEGNDAAHPLAGGTLIHAVAATSAGRILGVGAVNESGGGRPAGLVTACLEDGRVDTSFGSAGRLVLPAVRADGFTGLTAVEMLPDGGILAAGYLGGRLSLVRITADGRLDQSFGAGGMVRPVSVRGLQARAPQGRPHRPGRSQGGGPPGAA
jgi:Domain of unknown function (DUF5122) beta-propeller